LDVKRLAVLLTLCVLGANQAAFADDQWQAQQMQNGYGQQQFNQQQFNQQPQYQQQFQMQGQVQQNAGFVPNGGQQSTPMLNSAMSPEAFSPYNSSIGTNKGVDILDESLKYHNIQPRTYGMQMNGMQNGMQMNGMQNNMQNGMMGNNTSGQNFGACQHNTGCGGNHRNGNTAQNNSASTNSGGGQISTQAIGAIGAAALVGTFLSNGGIGGMLKSVGWNNTRQVRGAAIGY